MNKIRIFFSIFFVLIIGFVLISCDQGAGSQTSEKQGLFSDVKIIFFPGGNEGCSFASVVYNGAKAAQEEFGCKVDYLWSDWNPETMVSQLKDAIALKPDGIAIMGHPGDDAYEAIVDEAVASGIIVTSQNTTLQRIESKYKDKGFGYVGQELYASGYMITMGSAKRAGLTSGDKALVWGLLAQAGRGQRTKGCVDALEDLGVKVIYLEIDDKVNADATLGGPILVAALQKDPDIKLIITDHGNLTSSAGSLLKQAGKKPGEIFVGGFDLSSATVAAIKEGWVGAVLDQQPWLQGFLPVLQICLTKKYGFAGLHIDTGAAIIDKTNIDFIAPLAEQQVR